MNVSKVVRICFYEGKNWDDKGELVCTGSSQLMRVEFNLK